jgi:hypothetical protein
MKSKKKAGNTWYAVYIGKRMGGDWFSVRVMLANRVDAALLASITLIEKLPPPTRFSI